MTVPNKPRVVIAGGGTAGWIAAAALARHLGPLIDVTLVESEEIGTVGVGEATIPTAQAFHRLMGLDERAFMAATGATFKLGIAFDDWGGVGDRYLHSFGEVGKSTWMADFQHFWLEAAANGDPAPIGAYCREHQAALAGRFAVDGLNYAYHLDAGRYAAFLRRQSEAIGVTRVEGRIATVERDGDSGLLTALTMGSGAVIPGDLFLDCTGFAGLLIDKTMGVGFEDWGHWLTTDRALAVQTESVGPPLPYTRAIAHDAGWQWRIPLQHRIGNGIVYSAAHLSDDAAQARLLGSIEGRAITEPRLIRYRTGRRERVWAGNCVALGLSSGFVEPLESTSIHLIMTGVTRLIQSFPFDGPVAATVDRYNDDARAELESVRDFVLLHYVATERDDTDFWRGCRDRAIPDSLARRIALFRDHGLAYQASDDLFRVDSWVQVLLGQRVRPRGWHHAPRLLGEARLRDMLGSLRRNVAGDVAKLPTHAAFLARYLA